MRRFDDVSWVAVASEVRVVVELVQVEADAQSPWCPTIMFEKHATKFVAFCGDARPIRRGLT